MPITERRSCGNKTGYLSPQEAQDAIWFLIRKRGTLPGRMNAYKCAYCGFYHIGHKPKPRRRGVKSSWTTA